jgi:hypothetical protein
MYLKTNTAVKLCVGPFLDKTDGVTPEVSLTVANSKITLIAETDDNNLPTIILDNVAGNDGTNTLAHITNDDAGYYSLLITAANVNRLGRMKLAIVDAANHCPVFHEIEVLPANIYDSLVLGTDYLNANAYELGGTTQTGRDIGTSVLLSSGTGTGQIALSSGNVTSALTSSERSTLAAAILDLADAIETGLTMRQALRLALSALAGKISGGGTTTETFRNAVADSKNRIVATVDASGNRTAITTDLT